MVRLNRVVVTKGNMGLRSPKPVHWQKNNALIVGGGGGPHYEVERVI